MSGLRGSDRAQWLIYGMVEEGDRQKGPELAQDGPEARANRPLKSWRDLKAKEQEAGGRMQHGDRARLDRDMRQVAHTVRDDPEVERILTERAREFGMDLKGRTMSQGMERQINQREGRRSVSPSYSVKGSRGFDLHNGNGPRVDLKRCALFFI